MQSLMSKKCYTTIIKYLKKEDIMLEIGSGGSTCNFCNHVKKLYSIESEKDWYYAVQNELKLNKINNVELKLVESNIRDEQKGGHYWTYAMYKDYVNEIENFNTNFDVIFIDGMARQHCYLKSFLYLRETGYLIIHDFYNVKNINKMWNINILFKYFTEVESIKEVKKGNDRGNDVLILRKNNIEYDENDMELLDLRIPRF